jgi:hypothetical protein
MQTTSIGYVFDARKDVLKQIGLLENYKLVFNKGVQYVFLTFSIDSTGKPLIPSFIDIGEGFRPLTQKIEDNDVENSMLKFARSNKPTISTLNSTAMIVEGKFAFDRETGEFLPENALINLYIPKVCRDDLGITNTKGEAEPGILCEVVRKTEGLNTFVVDSKIYDSYINNILKYIRGDNTKDRVSFLVSRVSN